MKKDTQEADRCELECEAETVVFAAWFFDERSIGVVEVESPGKLSGGGTAREPSVAALLFVAPKISGQCGTSRAGDDQIEILCEALSRVCLTRLS